MKRTQVIQTALLSAGLLMVAANSRAAFSPIPLNSSSYNADPVIEAAAPRSLNDFVGVTLDSGTNKTGSTWYEMGYNTNLAATPTYSGALTGLPHPGATFTAVSNANRTFQMAPSYSGNNVIFVGHNLSQWSPILGPGTFTLTTPTALSAITVLNCTGNGANTIGYTVHHQDASTETGTFSSPDWVPTPSAVTAWRSGGTVSMNGGVNNFNNNAATMSMSDIVLGNTVSPVTSIDFFWAAGTANAHSPWGNGRTFIFAVSGSTDNITYSPLAVTGYDHDGILEAAAPFTTGTGDTNRTGVLINDNTYCSFTMDGGIWKNGSTWYEAGYYASYPNSGIPAAGSTITSATEPAIQYTMPLSYVGNCGICLSSNLRNDTITFAAPTSAGSLAFLVGGGNGGLNLRVEIQYQGGASETNWIIAPDWFTRTTPWAYVGYGRMAPSNRSVNNTPDQFQNNFVPPQSSYAGIPTGIPSGQPFSRDPRNGGASFPNLPGVRLYDAIIPIANSGALITSMNVVVTNIGTFGNSATIFAVSGSPGAPPVITVQPFGLVTDAATGFTNAITGQASPNNIVITKGWQGTNNITLVISNAPFNSGLSYQWKKAPRGGGWRDGFLTGYDMSTFANVTAPNVSGAQSSVMTISNATLADTGDYLVVLSNPYGTQTSFVATVMVLTTNVNILSGVGAGDIITKYTSDGSTGGSETYLSAIDQKNQKWLSTGVGDIGLDGISVAATVVPYVGPAGYVVIPVNGTSIVSSIQFFCANDAPGRDPRDYLLEGSLDGSSWTSISGGQLLGTLMLPSARPANSPNNPLSPMGDPLLEVDFANSTPYKQYRVTITNCMEPVATPLMQIAEIRLLGSLLPSAPTWVREPEPGVTVFAGTRPTWGVQVAGIPPPKFQWYTNGVAALNATNATFTLTNVQLADSGKTVFCRASNAGGTIESIHSTLTVIAPPSQAYPSAVLANGPMAYWRLDEGPDDSVGDNGVVTHDYAGGFNGYYSNATIAVSGYNPASDPNTAAQFGNFGNANNLVAGINTLSFARGTNTPGATFSVEAWVFGGLQNLNAGIVAKGFNGGLLAGTQTGTEQFVLDVIGTLPQSRVFRFLVRDFFGNGYPAQSSVLPSDPITFQPAWHHLVGVCDQPNGKISLYVDGVVVATGTIPATAGILAQSLPITIGSRPSGGGAEYDNQWIGTIDDVAVYGSALSASQILTHYYAAQRAPLFSLQPANLHTNDNSTAIFSSFAYGPGSITYQWYNSDGVAPTTPIGGQTSSNYVFTATTAANGNFYQIVAANAFGAVTSVVVQLTVESGAPAFVFQDLPAAQTAFLGHVIQLHVAPSGTAPFTYQWKRNGANMSDDYRTAGTTSDTLTIGYGNFNDTATYSVAVTGQGTATSTQDALTVTTNGSGFFTATANPSDWSLNAGATLSGQSVTLTVNAGNTARTAFLNTKQNIASFNARFVYQEVLPNPIGGGGADGVTFCIQNQAVTAVGGGGGLLGYGGITPSVGLALNVYNPQTRGMSFFQNGTVTTPFFSMLPNVGVGDNNNPVQVDVSYNGTVVTATFKDTVTLGSFTTNITVNIPSILGASTAWVGFTGADGGVASQQVVSWSAPAAVRIPIKFQKLGANTVLTWPASAGAFLQWTPALGAPSFWNYDNTDTFRVVGTNATVTVPTSTAGQYFRLQLFP